MSGRCGTPPPDPAHTLLIFDLDNCLYPHSCGIGPQMSLNLLKFCKKLGMDELEARRRCFTWYRAYGMSLHGLVEEHGVDIAEFDAEVDLAVDLDQLPPELPAVLDELLSRLSPYRKTIFTNAQRPHAERILGRLGIRHHFEAITSCDYSRRWFIAKPEGGAYHRAMLDAGVFERWEAEHVAPEGRGSRGDDDKRLQIYFFDDNLPNCQAAVQFGWHAVHIDEPGKTPLTRIASEHALDHHTWPEHVLEHSERKRIRNDLAYVRAQPHRHGKLHRAAYIWELEQVVPELFLMSGKRGVPMPIPNSFLEGADGVSGPADLVDTEEGLMKRAEEEGVEVLGGGLE